MNDLACGYLNGRLSAGAKFIKGQEKDLVQDGLLNEAKFEELKTVIKDEAFKQMQEANKGLFEKDKWKNKNPRFWRRPGLRIIRRRFIGLESEGCVCGD